MVTNHIPVFRILDSGFHHDPVDHSEVRMNVSEQSIRLLAAAIADPEWFCKMLNTTDVSYGERTNKFAFHWASAWTDVMIRLKLNTEKGTPDNYINGSIQYVISILHPWFDKDANGKWVYCKPPEGGLDTAVKPC